MAIKKSQLYASLWESCDELRGGMDASQYKDYILTLLFMKYVSDKTGSLIRVPDGGGFADMVKLKGDIEIGDKINKIIGKLADKYKLLKGVIDLADFNDESKLGRGKEMQERLSKLVAIFERLDLRMNRAEGDDLLGDAYEYLMRHFATESGKSKGQFYTPSEVSRIMAQVIGIGPKTKRTDMIYDPTCGSGSLLLKAADEAPNGISVYGQEKDNTTYALAWMNMILHGYGTAELRHGNTLAAPDFSDENGLKTFDFAVANPPFSDKAWRTGLNPKHDPYGRFKYGVPPAKNGDYAFLLHFIASLSPKGKGAIILPHGVLFRGNREGDIRQNLIERGFIKGIIGLPANLFYGTGIPACILVIDKENARDRDDIFMIDASKGFLKDGNKNRLQAQDIHKIVSVFNDRQELPRYSRIVPLDKIAANSYSLNIRFYIDSSEREDLHDLDAHLNGGIPDRDIEGLKAYWQVFPTLRDVIFKGNGRPGYSEVVVKTHLVRATILDHSEFACYQQQIDAVFEEWCEVHEAFLLDIGVGTRPKEVIGRLSEDLLVRFRGLPLIDAYDVYQRLMDYWDDVMQDDAYLIAAEGWVAAAEPREIIQNKRKKIKETPDLTIKKKKYKMDLVPPSLIVARYFAAEQAAVERLQDQQSKVESELEEFVEEHIGEEGALVGLEGKSGIPMGNVQNRVMEHRANILKMYPKGTPQYIRAQSIKKTTFGDTAWTQDIRDEDSLFERLNVPCDYDEDGLFEELEVLHECLRLLKAKKRATEAHRQALNDLHTLVSRKYYELSEAEVKTLVVVEKWFPKLQSAIGGEVERVIQALTGRVKELEERYAQRLPDLEREVEVFGAKVEAHLRQMGVNWE